VLLLLEGAQVATNVTTSVVGGSLHCYIFANQQSRFQTSSPLLFLFFALFIFLSRTKTQEEVVFKEAVLKLSSKTKNKK